MNVKQLQQLVLSVEEDEQRDLCDQRIQGKKSDAEVDAALVQASQTIRELRRHSEPLREAFKQKLAAQMLASSVATEALPVLATPDQRARVQTTSELRSHRPRRRVAYYAAGIAMAVASVAVIASPSWLRSGELPQMSLELAEHSAQLLAPAPSGATGTRSAHRGGCIELGLRPQKSYDQELQTQILLFQDPARPLKWSVPFQRAETGLLRQEGPCVPLPKEAVAGDWTLLVVYGRSLPAPTVAAQTAAAGSDVSGPWRYKTRLLYIVDAEPAAP